MNQIVFNDPTANPFNNYVMAIIRPVFIIGVLMIGIPLLATETLSNSIIYYFILPGICLIVYELFVWYRYSKKYISRIEINETDINITSVKMNGQIEYVTIDAKSDVAVLMKESILSFNTIGIPVFSIVFKKNDHVLLQQFPVGLWSTAKFKDALIQLRQCGIKVVS